MTEQEIIARLNQDLSERLQGLEVLKLTDDEDGEGELKNRRQLMVKMPCGDVKILRACWSDEAIEDAKAYHGLDLIDELFNALTCEIHLEALVHGGMGFEKAREAAFGV